MNAPRMTAIIADDEPRLAEFLRDRLAVLWPELLVAGIARNGPEAQGLIEREAPDVAFLDIRMPGLSGIEVARAASREVRIVFVTAYDQYAVQAFERAAVDYVLKPVSDERLGETIGRLRSPPSARSAGLSDVLAAISQLRQDAPERLAWIRASRGTQVVLIDVNDVIYFQANDKYTGVFTAEGESLIRTPLRELADQLDARHFWQVHRGTIVNVREIAETSRDLAGRVTLRLRSRPETVAVSRAYAHLFKQM
ncbi:MAG: LytTR family DNA-binding domain-containing protein [Burkholderiales bacterium]